jgi:hypothetical protein
MPQNLIVFLTRNSEATIMSNTKNYILLNVLFHKCGSSPVCLDHKYTNFWRYFWYILTYVTSQLFYTYICMLYNINVINKSYMPD